MLPQKLFEHISAAETGSAAVLVIHPTAIASASGRSPHLGRSPIGSEVGEHGSAKGWRVSLERCAIKDSLLQSSRVPKISIVSTIVVDPARICLGPKMVS